MDYGIPQVYRKITPPGSVRLPESANLRIDDTDKAQITQSWTPRPDTIHA